MDHVLHLWQGQSERFCYVIYHLQSYTNANDKPKPKDDAVADPLAAAGVVIHSAGLMKSAVHCCWVSLGLVTEWPLVLGDMKIS